MLQTELLVYEVQHYVGEKSVYEVPVLGILIFLENRNH